MSTQTNAELNKLKKSELIERSVQLRQERDRLTALIETLQNGEAGLQARVLSLQDEKAGLEGSVAELTSEKQLFEQKYAKVKRKLKAKAKNLRIPKPRGQVDRSYKLHEAMKAGGQLEVSKDEYRKINDFARKGVDRAAMDKSALWKNQNHEQVASIITAARAAFPILRHYVNTWPITDMVIRYLANHRKYNKAKAKLEEAAGEDPDAQPDMPAAGGNSDSDDDDDDVYISD